LTSPNDPIVAALQRILDTHHAAVFGYPVIGVNLTDPAQIATARMLEARHRASRDQLMSDLAARSAQPDQAAPSYLPPEKVTSPVTAQRWALQLEEDCAAAYRYLLSCTAGANDAAVRTLAVSGLTATAQQSTRWRRLLTPATPTVPFPGT
jgi:hypothetical protein